MIDAVRSYTALRSVAVQGDRFVLNGRPYMLRLVLDQGYWPDSGLTAPDDDALRRDVELAKAMGFNGVRKHQKIEDPRYLYWADTLGLLVWEEMPSAYRFTTRSVERLTREWMAVIERDCSHPCIVAWVPFNESWGVPDLPDNPRAAPLRPGAVPPDQDARSDPAGDRQRRLGERRHRHHRHPRLRRPAGAHRRSATTPSEVLPRLFTRERPGGRLLVLERRSPPRPPGDADRVRRDRAGPRTDGTLGLQPRPGRPPEFADALRASCSPSSARSVLICGFCYTQFADTYQEANGLLFADRTPKFPLSDIAAATAGTAGARTDGLEQIERTADAGEAP